MTPFVTLSLCIVWVTTACAQLIIDPFKVSPDPHYSSVELLLHCDGSDGSTTFTDNSTVGNSLAMGPTNTQIDTAQSKFGGASCLFDGTDDNLVCLLSCFENGFPGDFTIEGWIRLSATGVQYVFYDERPVGTQGAYPTILVTSGNVLRYVTSSSARITGTTTLSANTWYHWALARAGTSTRLFLNCTQEGSTYTDSATYIDGGGDRPIIGTNGFSPSSDELNGWLDDVRVTLGVARYTGTNDVCPTEAFWHNS